MGHPNDQAVAEQPTTSNASAEETARDAQTQKKPFVEPTISVPQDVLETTKFFFQAVEAGSL